MKNTQFINGILSKVLVAVILCLVPSCKHSEPVMNLKNSINGISIIDTEFNYYSQTDCIFLMNSSTLNPQNIRNIYCYGPDLYMLFPDLFLHYDLVTGSLLHKFSPLDSVNFIDFSFDKKNSCAYILDNKKSQVLELTKDGQIIKTIKLDTSHTYSKIKQLANQYFLVSIQTIPHPSFLRIDFEQDVVEDYKFQHTRKAKDIPVNSDSIWEKYPLYVADERPQGVMLKYLFDDYVYNCTKDSVTIDYSMDLGKQKVKKYFLKSPDKLKDNDRFRIINFWHTDTKVYVLSQFNVENIKGKFDYKSLSQFKNFKSVGSYGGFTAYNNLASLNPARDKVFMDNERKRFLSFRKLTDKEKKEKHKWPQHMLEADNDDEIVVSVFYMK